MSKKTKDDGWVTVSYKKRKKQTVVNNQIDNDNVKHVNRKREINYEKKKEFKLSLSEKELEDFDPLSLLVYHVLSNGEFPEPSSFIKKEVNRLIEVDSLPDFVLPKKHLLKTEYTKKDIGYVLYDGPISKYVVMDDKQIPRLWSWPNSN